VATITLTVIVSDIDTVRQFFDRIKVYRSVTGVAGPYVEITSAGTRPVLIDGQITYAYTDTAGDNSYFYKTSFFNSVSTLESSLSDAQQGEGDPALDVISVEELKQNFLFGVDLTDDFGNSFPDSMFQFYIKGAVSWIERKLDIPLRPLVINSPPEKHDFIRQDYRKWVWLQLLNYPVISVEEIKLVLPTNQEVITYDPSWISVDKAAGVVQIVPGSGQLLLGSSGAWLPLLYGWIDFVPEVFHVKYTSGFEKGKIPDELKELVGKMAAMGPLNIAGDLVFGAGLAAQSVSLDGLATAIQTTQSPTNSGYGARIVEYWREVKNVIPDLRRSYKGTRMVMG
jgi:hypothetical protein